jgi:hypothetical protein
MNSFLLMYVKRSATSRNLYSFSALRRQSRLKKIGLHFSRDSHYENSQSIECPLFIYFWIKEFVMGCG